MMRRNVNGYFASIKDFADKCRICLKNYDNMVDIFDSEIINQIMEVTNINISSNDKLPRNMCQDCKMKLRELHMFQCLAKESDKYLRALLNARDILDSSVEDFDLKNEKEKKRKIHSKVLRLKSTRKSKESSRNDKMYLILVKEAEASNKTGSQNEICIKDLDGDNENTELTEICKSLIKHQNNNYSEDSKSVIVKTEIGDSHEKGKYKVNLVIYKCSECEKSFELKELLIEHLKNLHKIDSLNALAFSYKCPVCVENEKDKNLFMIHLANHKREGFSFYKVDNVGNNILLTDLEKEIFELPKVMQESVIRNRIYKINTNCYTCYSCKIVASVNGVSEHLKICYPNYKQDDYHVKYTCPACYESWIDDLQQMKIHLSSHQMNNVYFVKVNESGQSVELTDEDVGYTEFERALQRLTFDERSKVIKIENLDSCVACPFEADSASSLSDHYVKCHEEMVSTVKTPCPVCGKHFELTNSNFLDHLIVHQSEGFVFLKVSKTGSIERKNCDLFTDPNELFDGRISCPELEFIDDVYVPEVYIDRTPTCEPEIPPNDGNRSDREYVCEKCGRKCFGRGNYRRHFTTHAEKSPMTGAKRPICSVCNKTFSNRTSLNEHQKHHGIDRGDSGRKICEICGVRVSNSASLAKHRRLHADNRESSVLKCKFCERGFRREPSLNRHVSHHLNPNYFECEVCKLPLPSSASLDRHKSWHEGARAGSNTHDCKVCKLSFLTKERLTSHQTHTGHHPDKNRFECNVCHERFFIGREFSKHIKTHPKYKMSECSLCGKRLSTMQSLMLHLSRHFESNSILCPHCGKQFFEERNYHRHLLTHKGFKPFSCDFDGCKKSFYTYFELNRHKKYHNNTRDFSCPYCPKCFHEANHLKVHIRTHTGERPYTCPHCNKGFVTRTRCKQHINLIHQGIGCDLIQSSISKKVAVFEALETVA